MAIFKCSGCGFEKQVPAEYAGKRVKCPKCHAESRVGSAAIQPVATSPQKPIIKFHCPHCSQKIGVAAQHVGKKVRCTKCSEPVTIPASSEATSISPPRKPSAPKPPAHKTASASKPHVAPAPPAQAAYDEMDELSLKMEPMADMDDLLNMEKQVQAVERIADIRKPEDKGAAGPGDAVAELMRQQARAAGRRQVRETVKPVNMPILITVCTIGAISSVIVLAAMGMFLFAPQPQSRHAAAEAFIRDFMSGHDNGGINEYEADTPAIAGPNVVEPNALNMESDEQQAAQHEDSEYETSGSHAMGSDDGLTDAAVTEAADTLAAPPPRRPRSRRDRAQDERPPFGPEIITAMTQEQQSVQEYLDRRQDDRVSMGAVERMTPMTSGLDHALALIRSEPSLTLVGSVQCHMPDNGQSGFSLTYRPSRSGDMDQMLIFYLETQGDGFIIQGLQAKRTIFGWSSALPPRASRIMNLTSSPAFVRRALALPAWCWFVAWPALVVVMIVWLGSLWVVFAKTGRMASASLVPVYNLWALADIGGKPGWLSLLIAAAVVPMLFGGAIMYGGMAAVAAIMLVISLGVAGELNKSSVFGLGLWLLPAVFYPILAATTES